LIKKLLKFIYFKMKFLRKNNKGDLEIDELGKLILGLILLLVLIVIVTVYINGEFINQEEGLGSIFGFF